MLAHIDLGSTGTQIQIYRTPSGQTTTATIVITNRNTTNVKIRLLISDTASPDNSYFLLYDQVIYPNDVYIAPGVVLNSQDYVFVQTDTLNVNVVMYGFSQ